MIYLVLGTNAYVRAQEIARLSAGFAGEVERYDGISLTPQMLIDIISGGTLFAATRFVVVQGLSQQKATWGMLGQWLDRMSDDVTLVLVEDSVDKRLKATKQIMDAAKVIMATPLGERESRTAEQWLDKLAHQSGVKLSPAQIRDMVRRAYVPSDKQGRYVVDQYMLYTALRSLVLVDTVSDEAIATVLPESADDVIFSLLEVAVSGQGAKTQQLLDTLRPTSEPHMVFSLIASQWVQLLGIKYADTPSAAASGLGINPFVADKLAQSARAVSTRDATVLTRLAADLDARLKRSEVTAWEAVDRFVLAIATRDTKSPQ